jgi:DNA polymerase epsilon subunit 1
MIRRELLPLAKVNASRFTAVDAYADVIGAEAARTGAQLNDEGEERAWGAEDEGRKRKDREPAECIIDVREHDIAYYLRVAIDLGEPISCSLWRNSMGRLT